jgi:hypothetical protein
MTTQTKEQTQISGGQCPERLPNISEYEVEEEVVLYDPRSDAAHVLNPTAAVVWWLCDGDHKIKDIARELGDLYDKEPDSVRPDVDEIISGLMTSRLIRWK